MVGGALSGCAAEEPIDTPEATLDAADAIDAEATFMFAVLHGTESPPDSELELVAGVGANVPLRWTPSGCAHVTQPNSVALTIMFDDCSGPRGLVHVTGTLDLALIGWPAIPSFRATSPTMSANGSTFTVNGTVSAGMGADEDVLHGDVDGVAVGPRGNELERRGGYSVTWPRDSECSSIAANTESDPNHMDGYEPHWFTSIGVTRCPGRCPTGFVIRRFPNEAGLRLDMDGTPLAVWTSRGKRTDPRDGTFVLACE